MTNDNDLIRRGDALNIYTDWTLGPEEAIAKLRALPAVAASHPADPVINADRCQRVTVKPPYNDRIISDGFPAGWYIQDRLDTNEALLCRKSDFAFGGSVCICLRPRAMDTDEWMGQARMIAAGFEAQNTAIDVQPDPRDAQIAAAMREGMRIAMTTPIEQVPEAFRADLAAVPAQVRVNPLVWVGDGHWHSGDNEGWLEEANTPFGWGYAVEFGTLETGPWKVSSTFGSDIVKFDTPSAAKAAAQADYESRILAALAAAKAVLK